MSDQAHGNTGDTTHGGVGHSSDEMTRFTEVYTSLLPPVRGYLAKRVDYQAVEDLLADVFAVAWQKRSTVTAGEELPWLFRIASFIVANHRRKASTAAKLLSYFTIPDTSPPADAMITHDPGLQKAWAALKPSYREALALVILEDLAVNDAAIVIGITPNTLSIRLHRAKKQLAEALTTMEATKRDAFRGKKPHTDDI